MKGWQDVQLYPTSHAAAAGTADSQDRYSVKGVKGPYYQLQCFDKFVVGRCLYALATTLLNSAVQCSVWLQQDRQIRTPSWTGSVWPAGDNGLQHNGRTGPTGRIQSSDMFTVPARATLLTRYHRWYLSVDQSGRQAESDNDSFIDLTHASTFIRLNQWDLISLV